MVIDLKVHVRSFNCESRACYVGNPRESFSRVRERFFSRKLATMNHYHCIHYGLLRATTSCRPGPAGEWHCSIGRSQASEGEPNTIVLKHLLAPATGTA